MGIVGGHRYHWPQQMARHGLFIVMMRELENMIIMFTVDGFKAFL